MDQHYTAGAGGFGRATISVTRNGITYTEDQWHRIVMEEKMDKIISLLQQLMALQK
jgi:hypothetical protein